MPLARRAGAHARVSRPSIWMLQESLERRHGASLVGTKKKMVEIFYGSIQHRFAIVIWREEKRKHSQHGKSGGFLFPYCLSRGNRSWIENNTVLGEESAKEAELLRLLHISVRKVLLVLRLPDMKW